MAHKLRIGPDAGPHDTLTITTRSSPPATYPMRAVAVLDIDLARHRVDVALFGGERRTHSQVADILIEES
jgi:hypothetical protein